MHLFIGLAKIGKDLYALSVVVENYTCITVQFPYLLCAIIALTIIIHIIMYIIVI